MSAQESLCKLWLGGPDDRLCGREQAKAWALREVWRSEGKNTYGMLQFVASRLKKNKNGTPTGEPPQRSSLQEFFEKVDADSEWYPGKHSGQKRGPKRILTGGKLSAIVSAAKRLKREGDEPTYAGIVAACPQATLNPSTQEPVDKHLVYNVFREACYDLDLTDPWCHLSRLSRSALTTEHKEKRHNFAQYMLGLRHTPTWYRNHLVWCDLCNSILPRTRRKAQEMALARKGGKGWMSKGSQGHSSNLRKPNNVLKLHSSDTVRVWWLPILTRGKLHIELLPDNFPGDTEAGASIMVQKVRSALNVRFQGATAPKVLFTDRGNGFYNAGTGVITDSYRAALRAHGLQAFFPTDASVQPGQLQELMLHETAVSWMRVRLTKTLPNRCWEETPEQYRTRLKACAAHINAHHDVDQLCSDLPKRLRELDDLEGDRLGH